MCHAVQSRKSQLYHPREIDRLKMFLKCLCWFDEPGICQNKVPLCGVLGTLGYRVVLMVWRIQLQCHWLFIFSFWHQGAMLQG